jgi:hypothetical protein
MKKRLLLFGILIWTACEDPITLALPAAEENIVIDATLWRPVGENTGTLEVYLSKTADFYAEEVVFVRAAQVSLEKDGVIRTATEQEDGLYSIENITVDPDKQYTLHVTVGDITFTASEHLVLSTTIDAITQGNNALFSGEETEVVVQFTDLPNEGNYYLMDFGYNNLFVTRDAFYNGNQLTFSFFYDKYFPKETPTPIHLMGVDKDFYTYMQILISHAGQDGGGPFATAKSTLRGNIQNTTNPDAFPLGYFRVVERDTFIFTATDN